MTQLKILTFIKKNSLQISTTTLRKTHINFCRVGSVSILIVSHSTCPCFNSVYVIIRNIFIKFKTYVNKQHIKKISNLRYYKVCLIPFPYYFLQSLCTETTFHCFMFYLERLEANPLRCCQKNSPETHIMLSKTAYFKKSSILTDASIDLHSFFLASKNNNINSYNHFYFVSFKHKVY